jgi:hypothetical protein
MESKSAASFPITIRTAAPARIESAASARSLFNLSLLSDIFFPPDFSYNTTEIGFWDKNIDLSLLYI